MSTKTRRRVVVATVVAWAGWLGLYSLSKVADDPTIVHLVGLQASQMIAGMLTIATILGYLVMPMVATAQIWREIGIKEQQRHCDSCPIAARRAARLADVIPFPGGRLERSDN